MIKNYFFVLASTFVVATSAVAQTSGNDTLTFESFPLDPMTGYFNGSTLVPQDTNTVDTFYTLDNFKFDISFTKWSETVSSWAGYAVSRTTDTVTAGVTNQYSAYAYGGANGSEKYGVAYLFDDSKKIEFDTIRTLKSIDITNTTYAVQSMLKGDNFAKIFGSPNGADGNPDGTEGKDWFLLEIIPLDENDQKSGDTIKYYLADYRFDNDADDYIIKEWKTVNLENVKAKKLVFKLSSSDTGGSGMNTPAYFALDNLITRKGDEPELGITKVNTLTVSAYPNPASDVLTVNIEQPATLQLINAVGEIVTTANINGTTNINVSSLNKGLYFLTVTADSGSTTQKIIVR